MRKRAVNISLAIVSILVVSSISFAQGIQGQLVKGRVVSNDQQPVADARVEILDMRTGQHVSSAHTGDTGAFELWNVPSGEFEIVATAGVLSVRERISVGAFGMGDTVVLRMPFTSAGAVEAAVGGEDTVSVRQLKVPGRASSELQKAQEALNKGELERAHKHVERALKHYPHFPEALTMRAILKAHENDIDGAVKDCEQALFIDANYAMAYIVLAATFNHAERYSDALRSADRAVAVAPRSWQAYFELSKALLAVGDFDAALKQVDRAQYFMEEEYPPIHLVRAHALLGLERYDAATASLQLYLTKHPEGQQADEARRALDQVRAFRAMNTR